MLVAIKSKMGDVGIMSGCSGFGDRVKNGILELKIAYGRTDVWVGGGYGGWGGWAKDYKGF